MTSRTTVLFGLLGVSIITALLYFFPLNIDLIPKENSAADVVPTEAVTPTHDAVAIPPSTRTDVEFTYVMEEVVPGSDLGTYPKLTSHTSTEILKKVNTLLKEDMGDFGCLQQMTREEIEETFVQMGGKIPKDFYSRAYKEQEELLGFESYGRSSVLYAKNGVLSIQALKEYACKGPYPVNVVDYETYDMVRGERVSLKSLFSNFEKNKGRLVDVFERNYALQTHDKDCIEFLTEENYEYADFFISDKGFFISPSLPHVSQACGGDIEIPLDEIKPYLQPNSILTRLY